MKNMAIAVFLPAILSAAVYGQAAKQIDTIRAEVNLINKNVAKYQKRTKSVDDISLEGTETTYFMSGRGLKKITAKMYGETYRATAELYFSGEKMIFAFRKFERYDTQIGMDPPPKVAKTTETRVYFAGDKAVRVMEGKTILSSSTPRFAEAESEMNDLAAKLKKAYLN